MLAKSLAIGNATLRSRVKLKRSIMHALRLVSINLHTKFEVLRFTYYNDVMGRPKIQKGSRDPNHTHLVVVCHPNAMT